MKKRYISPCIQSQVCAAFTILSVSSPNPVEVNPLNPGEGRAGEAHSKGNENESENENVRVNIWED